MHGVKLIQYPSLGKMDDGALPFFDKNRVEIFSENMSNQKK